MKQTRRRYAALCFAALCLSLFLFSGCEQPPDRFEAHLPRIVGRWQMVSYTAADGAVSDVREQQVFFEYNADRTGKKTIGGVTEYTLTFAYDGTQLYTTAAYPESGKAQLRSELCTIQGDTMTVISYDEKATILLLRQTDR